MYFFFNDTATTEIYTYCHTLSRHDALPISGSTPGSGRPPSRWSPPASPFRRSSPSSSSINGGMLHLMQISHKIVLTGAAMGASALAMPAAAQTLDVDRKSVVSGTSVAVRVDLGGRRPLKHKKKHTNT